MDIIGRFFGGTRDNRSIRDRFYDARFADPTGRLTLDEARENYILAQTDFYVHYLEHYVRNADYEDHEMDIIRNLVGNGQILIANESFFSSVTFDAAYRNTGIDVYEYQVLGDQDFVRFSTSEDKKFFTDDREWIVSYVGRPKIIIPDDDDQVIACEIIHEVQHLFDEDEDYTLLEKEYRAFFRECIFWSDRDWEGFRSYISYVDDDNNIITQSDLYNSAMMKDIEVFYDMLCPLYDDKPGWFITDELIEKYSGIYPL